MARQESDREDLLREATALVRRAELRVAGWSEPVVAGFRRDGAASFYFGADPVLQFNAQRQLRRGYWRGALLKAEAGRLVSLTRRRSAEVTELVRHELVAEEQAALLDEAGVLLAALAARLKAGEYERVGQVPPELDIVPLVLDCLAALPQPLVIALRPHAG